jgi:hypothetical protein
MFHFETYMNKEPYRVPTESGYQWVMRCIGNRRFCYNMFRMHRNVFDKLHNVLVESWFEVNKEDVINRDFRSFFCGCVVHLTE